MIIKSLIIASIILNAIGFQGQADKIDAAITRHKYGETAHASASTSTLSLPDIINRPKIDAEAEDPVIYAKHYLLADATTGKIFTQEGAYDEVPIASTTKIMSAVVALENYKLNDIATVSTEASNQIGADAFLMPGERITIESLLTAMLIKSGNDAAYALAEHINRPGEYGTKRFVTMMNKKAKELGMKNTEYHDPAGLDTTGYSSAYDLYLATNYALKNTVFARIVSTDKTSVKSIDGSVWHELKNSNRLVGDYKYPGATGVKTGYMPEAGHILVGSAQRDGHTLIGIIIDTFADTAPASADECRKLLDWGWQNILW